MSDVYIPRYDSEWLYRMFSVLELPDLLFEYRSLNGSIEYMESLDDFGYGTPVLLELALSIRAVLYSVMAERLCEMVSADRRM